MGAVKVIGLMGTVKVISVVTDLVVSRGVTGICLVQNCPTQRWMTPECFRSKLR